MTLALPARAGRLTLRHLIVLCSLVATGAWAQDISVMATQAVKGMFGPGAVDVNARSAAQAQVFLRYLQSQAARDAILKAGMEPVVPDAP